MRRAHGHTRGANGKRTPTYNSWRAMIERCCYERHPFYADYGGRGIEVCERWRGPGGLARFLADMGERPAATTLDRIDVHGAYTPENCRWSDAKTQRWNRRDMAGPRLEFPPAPPAPQPAGMPF